MSRIQCLHEHDSIASLARKALTTISALSSGTPPPTEVTYTFKDEIDRFEIWRAEHGVDKGHLDHILRETTVLRERVMILLSDLNQVPETSSSNHGTMYMQQSGTKSSHNQEGSSIAASTAGKSTNSRDRARIHNTTVYQSLSPDDPQQAEEATASESSSGIDSCVSYPDSLPDIPLVRVHDIITSLLRIGPVLVNPAAHDRLGYRTHPDAGKYDVGHVKTKFPKADPALIDRLGKANWERRQYLRNLRQEYENNRALPRKLERMAVRTDQDGDDYDHRTLVDTLPSGPASEDEDSVELLQGFGDSVHDDMSSSTASIGPTSTDMSSRNSEFGFSSLATQSTGMTDPIEAFLPPSPNREEMELRYIIPPPPVPCRNYTGEPFLCPYCMHFLHNITSPLEWKSHVHEDIQPYVCTYPACAVSGKTYGTKSSWWQHERDRHRVQRAWKCKPCSAKGSNYHFATEETFDAHIEKQHLVRLTPLQLESIRISCLVEVATSSLSTVCPICNEEIANRQKNATASVESDVRNHIADHLEQLAYFVTFPAGVLAHRDDEDSEFQDDSESDEDFVDDIKSVASKETHMSRRDGNLAKVRSFIANQSNVQGSFIQGRCIPDMAPKTTRESAKQTSSSPEHMNDLASINFPLRVLTHPPNEHFYARQEVLQEMQNLLSCKGSICILQGVGGIGKTLTAVEYVYRNQDKYDAVFWIQADTAPGRSDSIHQLAMALRLIDGSEEQTQVTDKARTWLEETERRWLLVFDNAILWSDISMYLPNYLQRTNGSVLITSQKDSFAKPSENLTILRLNTLKRDAGGAMLLKYLGRDIETDPERHLAKETSTFVGGLPVAIAHVAGYVEYMDMTLGELMQIFRQWRIRAGIAVHETDELPLAFREASFNYDETLAMVWHITLRELTADASDVMNVLSFLNCEAIPESMIWGVYDDPALNFIDTREPTRQRRIARSLIKRRLVQSKTIEGEVCFSMHRSLQRGIREQLALDKGKQQRVFDQAVAIVRRSFPRSHPLQQPTPHQWSECQRLLPQLHTLRDVYHQYNPDIKGSIDFAELLTDAGMDQFERSITKDGLMLLKTAEDVLDRGWPDDHQAMRANIHAMIAIMYDNMGITQRQEAFHRRGIALSIRRKVFNEAVSPRRQDEILLYNSEMEYAISLLHYNRYDEAEPIIQKCLEQYQIWGTESEIPFEYSKYYNKIALVRLYQGRFDEAIKLARKSVVLMSKTGYTLFESRFKFDLACIILQSGDLEGALKTHAQIHSQRLEKLGRTNELTLHSVYAIGAIHELKGNHEEAIAWFREALDQRRSLTSWPEEAYSRAQYHMAAALLARGYPEDRETAQNLREKAVKVLRRLLPLDNPPELEHVSDEAVLFDHMLPISPGGPRFTGRGLLPYFMQRMHD